MENYKGEINKLQKQMLNQLNARRGTTLFKIIEAISQQAFAKNSLTVSQKNSTLAKKAGVTASTISRNLKKIKEKCADIMQISQNRNCEERFASLVFTFIPEIGSNDLSNGDKTELYESVNEPIEMAKNTSSLTTNQLVSITKDINTNTINNVNRVNQSDKIFELYLEYKKKGINKSVFHRVFEEVKNKRGIKNFIGYLRGALNNILNHISFRNGTRTYKNKRLQAFYDVLLDKND
ncbi:hypothetical protein FHE72_20480 [Rossellomorea vietnamensis]|uniref:Uncharacterized protein n=2 Tax=Rossellomorea vietnamensis TaxID=218284 RepID=A0A6I6UY20_9BACI|nr:hypothetical protein FHE72_20480 [Rossellomorea vietnamensis]